MAIDTAGTTRFASAGRTNASAPTRDSFAAAGLDPFSTAAESSHIPTRTARAILRGADSS